MPKTMPRKKADEAPHINREEVQRLLRTPLTEPAKTEAVDELLRKMKDHEELETERKEVNSGYRDRLGVLADNVKELRERIEKGEELSVDCEIVKNFTVGHWTLIRKDTGEVVERRDLTEDERQPDMLQGAE